LILAKIPKSRILNYSIVLYAFFIPLSLDIIRALVYLIIILWFIQEEIKFKLAEIKKEPLFFYIGLLLLLLCITLLWTDTNHIKFGLKYIERYWYLLPMLVIYTSIDKKFISYSISAFLLGMFISELVSYGIFFELIHIKGIDHLDPSPFMQHTLYSVFLVITAGILLDRILLSKVFLEKAAYLLFFTTVTANLFINAGRTGQFIYILMLFIVVIIHYRVTLKSILLISILSSFIPYIAFQFSPAFHQRTLLTYNSLSHFSYSSSIGIRTGLDIIAKDIFIEHPILGVGVGDYLSEKNKIIESKYPDWSRVQAMVHYHNSYAEFLVIAGIFGMLTFLMILISLAQVPIKDHELRMIKIIFILVFSVAALSDAMFHLNRPLSLFALLGGLILAQSRYEKKEAMPNH